MAERNGKTAKARDQERDTSNGKRVDYDTTYSRRGRSASLEPGALLAWSKSAAELAWRGPLLAWGTGLPC